LFNGFGRVVQTYQIDCSPSHATLDRLDLFGRAGAVSLPTIRYFQLSSDIKTIQLSANGRRVLASVCNRPGQLEHVVRLGANVEIDDVPDLSDDETSDRQNVPQWFPVRPRDYDELISRNRSFLVESHRRPIDRDADILAGRYQWYRFEPIGGWIGNDAMIRQTHTESVDENLRRVREAEQSGRGAMSTYWKLARNRDWDFEGYADQNVKIAAGASLVVDSDRPVGRVTIRVDGEVWQTCELSSRRGEIEFERQLPRRGRIRIESERHASFFLRGCIVPQADMFRRRLLQSFSAGARAIEIDYDKLTDEDELVSIKYFRPWASSIGTDGVSRLCVSVRSDGEAVDAQSVSIRPMKGWTIRQRIYEINSPMAGDSVVLDSGTPLCQGATCFFPLKSDLPTGKYRLVIEPLENASHGFVMVSQSIAGESPQRYLHSK
ncbi:MAG: hypothetical protein KDB00_25295, partial [Planctomycetales bacterium]|nr:hypothetical protein [Planctomycetales bacterium]